MEAVKIKLLRILFGFMLVCCCFSSTAADIPQAKTAELSKLNQLIKNIRDALSSDQGKKNQINQQLHAAEKSIQQISLRLQQINQDLAKQENMLAVMQNKQHSSEEKLQRQQALLAEQVRQAYYLNRQPTSQFTLGRTPGDMIRMQIYERRIAEAKIAVMHDLHLSLQQLLANQQRLRREKASLQQLLAQHQEQRNALKSTQQNKQELLTQINSKIQDRNARLAQLLANKQALENLIKKLRAQAQAARTRFPQTGAAFAKLQGKLPWPTKGRIVKRYGTQIDTSGLKYNGVLLSAPKGQAVQAVYPGKIVFANWLQGFGKMVIIDHGKGFMTLYGRNSVLYKNTGDMVRAGEVIAGVGNNSGQEQTGLYFEIRHNGRPSNPESWCSSK